MSFLLLTASDALAREVSSLLKGEGFEDFLTMPPAAALENPDLPVPELVLLDLTQPPDDALALARSLRNRFALPFLPFMALVTGPRALVIRALAASFDDALALPDDRDQLPPRVRNLIRLRRQTDAMAASNRHLMELSSRDELTGLYNRRYFFECLALEFERAIRYQQPLSCLMIDLDEFKPINDNYGHLVGDALFKKAAELFRSIPRRVDVVARYGGDEVAALLPATRSDAASVVANRICRTLARQRFHIAAQDITMTVSVGVATMNPDEPTSPDVLLTHADHALYAAKRAGRNNVKLWSEQLDRDNLPPEDSA